MERFLIMTRITRELLTTFVSIRIEKMVLETMSCSDISTERERVTRLWSLSNYLVISTLTVFLFERAKVQLLQAWSKQWQSARSDKLEYRKPQDTLVHAIGDVNYMNGKLLTKHQVLHFVENSSRTAARRVRFSVPRDLFLGRNTEYVVGNCSKMLPGSLGKH